MTLKFTPTLHIVDCALSLDNGSTVGYKSAIAALKHGIPTISPIGGNLASSPNNAKIIIDLAKTQYGESVEIAVVRDAGDCYKEIVVSRHDNQIKFLQDLGCKISVAWWGQEDEEKDDIDEIDSLDKVEYLSPEEFNNLVTKLSEDREPTNSVKSVAVEPVEQPNPETEILRESSDKLFEAWKNDRRFTPTITINQPVFDFPAGLSDDGVIMGVRSFLGSQKTQAIVKLIYKYRECGIVLLGYRNNLLHQIIQRVFDYARELGEHVNPIEITHIKDDDNIDNYRTSGDPNSHIATCVDSMHKIKDYTGRIVIIDEVVGVLDHTTSGGTLKDNQPRCLASFAQAMREASMVIALDGNLADNHINHLSRLAPEKQVVKILNEAKMNQHNFVIVEGVDAEGEIKKADKSAMLKALSVEGDRIFMASDSKNFTERVDSFLKKNGKTGIVVNSETIAEDLQKEFLKKPDVCIKKYGFEYVIISPSAESGISVDGRYVPNGNYGENDGKTLDELEALQSRLDRELGESYFNAKFTFFCGVLSTNSQLQLLFRLRDSQIPHYVFCPEISQLRRSDRATPFTCWEREFTRMVTEKASISLDVFKKSTSEDSLNDILIAITSAMSKNQINWSSFSIRQGVRDNIEQLNYRHCLIYGLEEEMGHPVKIVQETIDVEGEIINEKLKEEGEILLAQNAKEIFEAKPMESIEKAREAKKKSPKKGTRRSIEKTELFDRYPGLETSEIFGEEFLYVLLKNKSFSNQVRNDYLIDNIDISTKHNEKKWNFLLLNPHYFSLTALSKTHDLIWGLTEAGIHTLRGMEYHKWSPEIQEIISRIKSRSDIQIALNCQERIKRIKSEDDSVRFIGELLNKIGYENVEIGKHPTDNPNSKERQRIPHHKATPIDFDVHVEDKKLSVREFLKRAIATYEADWMLKTLVDWKSKAVLSFEEQAELCRQQFSPEWEEENESFWDGSTPEPTPDRPIETKIEPEPVLVIKVPPEKTKTNNMQALVKGMQGAMTIEEFKIYKDSFDRNFKDSIDIDDVITGLDSMKERIRINEWLKII